MSENDKDRYLLFGQRSPWDEYIVHGNQIEALITEAKKRMLQGYSAFILDHETNTQYTVGEAITKVKQ